MSLSWKVGVWKEGRHIDLWHINHFLSGVLCAGVMIIFDINFWLGFGISFFLMIAWEVVEVISGIRETKFNMYTDVVLSTLAFFIIAFIHKYYLSTHVIGILLYVTVFVFCALGLWGFWAYKKRKKAQQHK